jgi:hypothetical protein
MQVTHPTQLIERHTLRSGQTVESVWVRIASDLVVEAPARKVLRFREHTGDFISANKVPISSISAACFGVDRQRCLDVTTEVCRLMQNKNFRVTACVDLFGDPAPFTKKLLLIYIKPDSNRAVGKVECVDEKTKDEEDEGSLQQWGEHQFLVKAEIGVKVECDDENTKDEEDDQEGSLQQSGEHQILVKADEAEEVGEKSTRKRGRSGHQRQRAAKWRGGLRQRTPSPW